jgi:hypothetical protein
MGKAIGGVSIMRSFWLRGEGIDIEEARMQTFARKI